MNNQPALSDQIIFPTVDAAVAAATGAQLLFRNQSLKVRRAVIKAIRAVSIVNSERWGRMAVEETKMGRATRGSGLLCCFKVVITSPTISEVGRIFRARFNHAERLHQTDDRQGAS
jgi:hypothetical protein